MWKLIDNEAMLLDLEKGQIIALQEEQGYTKFVISTLWENSHNYVTLNHSGEEAEIKFLPISRLINNKWFVEAL